MIKLSELKPGNIIKVEEEGELREGEVVDISRDEHEALVDNSVQEFWYTEEDMHPILLDEEQLLKLGFEKEENEDGSVKYKKGAFRILLPQKGNFSKIEMWYREDRRHFNYPLSVHELQNLHAAMSKIPLEKA
jgi:hypothetical protein